MSLIETFVNMVNKILWNYLLLILLCGTGIYFTYKLHFIQIRKFKIGWKKVVRGASLNGQKASENGISSFQALATAIAAQVGTGNIAGAATAIAAGGPGAIFWMWVSAFFGMATIYAEAVLAQKHKNKDKNGNVVGGPVYYIKAAYKGKFGSFLASFIAIAIILALGFMGNMVQSNSIGEAFKVAFKINPLYVGLLLSIFAAIIFKGGTRRIVSVTEKMVPLMAILYSIGCIIILISLGSSVFQGIKLIFVMAFSPKAVGGGVLGITIQKAMRFGVARGLFSNEAGMGSTPHAHAIAKVKSPEQQGYVAIIGVFIDTFVILTLTSLVIVSSQSWTTGATGVALAQMAFSQVFGNYGEIFIAICMLFFAFSTILGWYFFGKINVVFLFGEKAIFSYSILVTIFITLGSILKVDLVWNMADMFNGLMVIPNLIGIFTLRKEVIEITDIADKLEILEKNKKKAELL